MNEILNAKLSGKFTGKSEVVVLILGAYRDDGERLTDAQKNAALDAAKAVLQVVGAEVEAAASTLLVDESFSDGDELFFSADISLLTEEEEE